MRQDLSNQLKPTELKLNKCMHTATDIKWALILVTIKILSLCLICVSLLSTLPLSYLSPPLFDFLPHSSSALTSY